jgi:hypothetical protein
MEFRSLVDAVRCAIEVQSCLAERNAGLPPEKRIEFRVGIHLGDVVAESDGDLMGDGIIQRCAVGERRQAGRDPPFGQAYWQVKGRLALKVTDLGLVALKNTTEPIQVSIGQKISRIRRIKPDVRCFIKSPIILLGVYEGIRSSQWERARQQR